MTASRILVAVAACCLIAACTGTSETIESGQDTNEPAADAVGDTALPEADVATDIPAEGLASETIPDPEEVRAEEALVECAEGEGCFADKCAENSDCQSGWCVEHMGEALCTITCQDECPDDWTCRLVADTAPDVVYICVSDHSALCKPCAASSDCKGLGVDDVCVDYGPEGSFCGGGCEVTNECPWGFTCLEVSTVEGILTQQCMADAGVCPCTQKSANLGLFAPCRATNEFGSCPGNRVCTEAGLSPCDAAVPVQEACNGVDDNCDGDVDEPDEVAGDYINLCNDDNDCTQDMCNGAVGCQYEQLDEGECVDNDACTIGDHCQEGVCIGLPIACDDDNPCTDDTCDGLGGCKAEFNLAPCDDGNPCTVADTCTQAECVGFAVECDCQTDLDCLALDDGDLCNGTLHCNKDKLPYECAVDPSTLVACPQPVGPDAICSQAACDPATGECSFVPDHAGFACDDGDSCTVGDQCLEGTCVAGIPALCEDANECTDDSCDAAAGCVHLNNSAPCSDGDVCTTEDTCVDGQCLGGEDLLCDDGNECTDDACDVAVGCVHPANQAQCDDGNDCTAGDHCVAGKCQFETTLECNDNNPCTADTCDALKGCVYAITAGPCDDGDPCTINDQCINGACQAGQAASCDDQNPCTDDSCNEAGICIHSANQQDCDDGNKCTLLDQCQAAKCMGTQAPDCDDGNVCTTDSCDPAQGCIHMLNDSPCDDADVCTTGDHCHLGACISSGALTCDDNNLCTDDGCNAQAGCTFAPNSAPCDDGNECTLQDTCVDGDCTPLSVLECDDENECTADYCHLTLGCTYVNVQGSCDDGDACTANSFCTDGACGGGIQFKCDDENLCTDDGCDPDSGCTFENNAADCDDGDECTDGDQCLAGTCASGGPLDCEDNNVCTDDSCDSGNGCVNAPVADETPCGQELHCMAGECVDVCKPQPGSLALTYSGSIQQFVVPDCVESLTIEVFGAEGGKNKPCPEKGGEGARMKGTFSLTPGETLKVVVAGRGQDRGGDTSNQAGSGGGGSFVWRTANSELLIAAGGGGAGAICTSGGSHAYASGRDGVVEECGTKESTNQNAGGCNGNDGSGQGHGNGWNTVKNNPQGNGSGEQKGGFGGGGEVANSHGGGGGGGYSGGGGKPYSGNPAPAGGGGGSYNSGTNQSNSPGVQTGHGKVVFTW